MMRFIREGGYVTGRYLTLEPTTISSGAVMAQSKDDDGIWQDPVVDVVVGFGRWERREPTSEELRRWEEALSMVA